MNIGIVIGSHRLDSQSRKVGLYLEEQIQKMGAETWLHDLAHDPLPLWDENLGLQTRNPIRKSKGSVISKLNKSLMMIMMVRFHSCFRKHQYFIKS